MKRRSSIDLTVERQVYYGERPSTCPRCQAKLQQEHAVYLVATRTGRRIQDSFMMSGDFGYYCAACPTVVIDPEGVSRYLEHGLPDWQIGRSFAVMGSINLDAIPASQQHLPVMDVDPLPLVPFTAVESTEKQRPASRPRKPRPKRSKRRR